MTVLDTTYFLQQVKLYGSIPSGRYTDAEILQIAGDCMLSQVVPMVISLKEEFYVQYEDQSITQDQSAYPIPYRAMGLSLREIKKIKDSTIIDMPRMSPEEILVTSTGNPDKFYLQGQDVILYPVPSSTVDTLRLSYFRTPSRPVVTTECAIITAIDRATGIITATPPTAWVVTSVLDFVSRQNGHKCLGVDVTPTGISTTTVTFSLASIPTSLAIGDYIALATEAPYMQVPDVCFDLVVKLTIAEILESMGDQAGLASVLAKIAKLNSTIVGLLTNRVQGAMKTSSISLI
jgi:hypothetical protein